MVDNGATGCIYPAHRAARRSAATDLRLRTAATTICSVMMKLLRKHRHWLMIVIAILAIPFVFYFVQRPDYGAMRSDHFARIYDRNVSTLEAQQTVRLFSLAQALGIACPTHPRWCASRQRPKVPSWSRDGFRRTADRPASPRTAPSVNRITETSSWLRAASTGWSGFGTPVQLTSRWR